MITRLLLAASWILFSGIGMAAPAIVAGKAVAVMPMPADARSQLNPVAAYDGKGAYLVVWQQGRFYHQGQSADILAARIDGRGRVLDRQPIVICNAGASQEMPQVAFSGGTFLVVWHDLRNGHDWDIYAARVNVDGKVLEPNGFLVAGGPENQASPVLAPADDGFLVVWQHYDRYYQLQAAMIPANGALAPANPLSFRDKKLRGGELALTRMADSWLLSWNDEKAWSQSGGADTTITRHFGRLAFRQGKVEVQAMQRAPAIHVGRGGGRFSSDGVSTSLYAGWGIAGRGNRVATGAMFGADGAVALKNPNTEQKRHWSGWDTQRVITLYDVNVSIDGPVAIAFGQGMYLAVARQAYSGKPSGPNRLLGSRLNRAGVRIDREPAWPVLHDSPHRIANPVLAGGHNNFLLAFEQEDASGRRQIQARTLKAE